MKIFKDKKYYIIIAVIAVIVAVCCIFFSNDNGTLSPSLTTSSRSSSTDGGNETSSSSESTGGFENVDTVSLDKIPEYSGKAYVIVNNNEPTFDKTLKAEAFETYSKLDKLRRCGTAFSCVCKETMPTEKREPINSVRPSGWVHKEYDFVDGKSLYNRCHLIGFQLTAENANERNLITGTRYMNTEMNPFENMVADYIRETGNHVLYMVTPIFKDNELVARGVQMQAYSIEDEGDGICYNVYLYNVQPGITINYKTGASELAEGVKTTSAHSDDNVKCDYILNVKSHKFHLPDCPGAADISENNKEFFKGSRSELVNKGFEPCGKCNP